MSIRLNLNRSKDIPWKGISVLATYNFLYTAKTSFSNIKL